MASTPVLDSNSGVYIGAWTNWSYGSVRGATITLTPRNGALLIAFLAFYVGLAGSSFWRIACFTIHQMLSSDRSEDGLYHQRQAILRNSATDVVGLWSFLQTNLSWRRNASSPFRRMLPLAAFSILHIAVFGVAGIFSSQVSISAGNEVLVSSSNCGHLITSADIYTKADAVKWIIPYLVQTVILSASYAQQCYRQDAVAQSCKAFIQPNISTTSSTASCPFNGMCVGNGDIALVLDTGHINSHFDLGLNAPPEDQFTIRKVTTCAPITTVGYSTPYNHTNSTADDYVEYYYGPDLAGRQVPYSYRYPSHLETNSTNDFQNTLDYTIKALNAYSSQPQIDLISRLQRSDADISLFLLSANNMVYVEPTEDLWYSAHLQFPGVVLRSHNLKGNAGVWFRDNPVSVLGCAEQYQFCNPHLPANSSCTSLVGLDEAVNMTDSLWRSLAQNISFYSIGYAYGGYVIHLDGIVDSLGVSSLTARNSLFRGAQGPLPNNQWQLEVQYWHSISMALLQREVLEQATGPTSKTVYPWLVKPQTKQEQAQCHNQKTINAAYTNFSILGLSIILVVGALLLLLSVFIDHIVGYIQKRRNLKSYKRLEWSMNQTLQLQRLAHEELGYGTWTHAADSIPTTQRGEKLSLIDTSDPDHPILVTPTPADHASVQESEAKPDKDEETTQSGGHQTPLESVPINEILSTGQIPSPNDETSHIWQPNETRQVNKVTAVLQTVSVNGSEEVVGSSSSWDKDDALRVAENHEIGNTSSNSIKDESPPISEDPILGDPVRSTSFTV